MVRSVTSLQNTTMSEHIPVPAEHSPRKESRYTDMGFMVAEMGSVKGWIGSDTYVEVEK